jgi:pimeloyl-ACP methyl ester carboxylesterase
MAPSYAPELRVAGVAVAAPVSDVASFATRALSRPDQFGVFVSIANGFHHVYPELRIGDVLTPDAVADLGLLEQVCIDRVIRSFTRPIEDVRRADPSTVPGWSARLAENRAGNRPLRVPALVIQGTEDPIVDPATAHALAGRYCAQGGVVDLRVRPGEGHNVVAEDDLFAWLADRLAMVPPPSTC